MNKSIFNDGKYDDEQEMLHQQHFFFLQNMERIKQKEEEKNETQKHIFRFEKLN